MSEEVIAHHHQEFYSSSKTMSFIRKESHFSTTAFTKENINSCLENGHHTIKTKCVSFESKSHASQIDENKCMSETSIRQEYCNGKETKSFIQQRVERLYGPGALAQGFFVTKRQKSRLSESEEQPNVTEDERHSKSMNDACENDDLELSMKQSTSSPSLPVLRHLRPEFRAQLPIIRKSLETSMQKSVTIPKLSSETKVNGHSNLEQEVYEKSKDEIDFRDTQKITAKDDLSEKDGHYFLKILEEQTRRLLDLANIVEEDLLKNSDLSEDVIGKLRSASGKAKLLVSQKMQQFRGLCTNNINQNVGDEFPTTNADLQGFWDMVMLQVDQVDALFNEINELKKNNWKELNVEKISNKTNGSAKPRRTINKTRPVSAANEEARKQREEQRKKIIEERRKAMKSRQSNPRESIEIFVSDTS